jgi:hypothetical protein
VVPTVHQIQQGVGDAIVHHGELARELCYQQQIFLRSSRVE